MINVIKTRYYFFFISWLLFIISLLFILFYNLNLWIDMTWWIQIEFSYKNDIDLNKVREEANIIKEELNKENKIINNTNVYKVSWENNFVIEVWFLKEASEKELEANKIKFKNQIKNELKKEYDVTLTKYTNIWASFWDYIKDTAKLTLIIAILWIAIYVAYAFSGSISWISSLSFAIITIITLFHDVFISSWFYIFTSHFLPEFKIDTFFITALLTILWYSINDTIVVFDRIRSNLKQFWWKTKNLEEIINMSIQETMTRSIYTSLTLAFVLATIFIYWPNTIKWFTLVMIYWTIVWTFSSIFIASPLLYELNKNKKLKVYKKKVIKNEDKLIV